MSVNIDNSDEVTYADFEHETVSFNSENPDGGNNQFVAYEIDPLSERGGLESDEIAEVVGMRIYAAIRYDPANVGDNGAGEWRGAFGFNLGAEDIPQSAPNGSGASANNFTDAGSTQEFGTAGGTPIAVVEEDGIVFTWDVSYAYPGSMGMDSELLSFRDIYGRGPVLDSTDSLSAVAGHINEDGSVGGSEANIRAHMVYDVGTVEGVRSRFSLPRRVE